MWKKPSAESEVKQRMRNRFPQTYVKGILKILFTNFFGPKYT